MFHAFPSLLNQVWSFSILSVLVVGSVFSQPVLSQDAPPPSFTPAQQAELDQATKWSEEVYQLFAANKMKEAVSPAEKSWEVRKRVLGPEHADTLVSHNDLALVLRGTGDLDGAKKHFENILSLYKKTMGDQHPNVGQTLNNLGLLSYRQNQFTEALSYFQQSLAIREAAFGKVNNDTLQSYGNAGRALQQLGRFKEARGVFEQVLEVLQAELGSEHERTATSLNDVGLMHRLEGNDTEARKYYEQALAIRRKVLGDQHPQTAISMSNLGLLLESLSQFDEAKPLLKQALAANRATLGEEHTDTAISYLNLAQLQQDTGDLAAAERNQIQAIKILKQVKGERSPETATAINNLGSCLYLKGEYSKAREQIELALRLRLELLGPQHPDTALSYNNFGRVLNDLGDYQGARKALDESVQQTLATLGENHSRTALAFDNLGSLLQSQGDFPAARQAYERGLAIRRKLYGENDPNTAGSLSNLGLVLTRMGDSEKAVDLYLKAFEVFQATFGEDHIKTATAINNLASVLGDLAMYEKALPLYERAYNIRKRILPPDHLDIALSLNNMANASNNLGDQAAAIKFQSEALEIQRKAFGKGHESIARSLNNLAYFRFRLGEFKPALELYRESLEMQRAAVGDLHPDIVTFYNNLALAQTTAGEADAALKTFDQARRAAHESFRLVLPSLNQRQQLSLVLSCDGDLHAPVTLAIANRQKPEFVNVSAEWILNCKGLSQAALAQQNLLLRNAKSPENQAIIEELLATRRQLAQLSMLSKDDRLSETNRKIAEQLTTREDELASKVTVDNQSKLAPWIRLDQVRESLDADEVLIEMIAYEAFDFKLERAKSPWDPARYAAWIIPAKGQGDVVLVDLGTQEPIDQQIEQTRLSITDVKRMRELGEDVAAQQALEQLAKLSEKIWSPLKAHVGDKAKVTLCPDNSLWLVPWSALPGSKPEIFLIEDKSIRLVISGRDRIPLEATNAEKQPSVIFADPQYDLTPQSVWEAIQAVLRQRAPNEKERERSAKFIGNRSQIKVERLPSSAMEADLVAPSLKAYGGTEPLRYQGQFAVENVLKVVTHPQVLMLSTHGFFIQEAKEGPPSTTPGSVTNRPQDSNEVSDLENPLLRCGLLFAGCNNPQAGEKTAGDDGVLTGMEIVSLDLRGTELVVLSACETGLGDVRNGEGVAGLRQAFQLAGAEAVIATLWSVPDRDSALLVNAFFSELAKQETKVQSLRAAQLQSIERRRDRFGVAHPYFWAAFTFTGH